MSKHRATYLQSCSLSCDHQFVIPVAKVHGSEMKMLLGLEDELKKSIIGQDEAIGVVSKAIRRGRSGITDSRRPIGSFLFMGPTGVGKTELARVIAREVFGGENALIKIDMSEFGESIMCRDWLVRQRDISAMMMAGS